jgi:hypothetical protein
MKALQLFVSISIATISLLPFYSSLKAAAAENPIISTQREQPEEQKIGLLFEARNRANAGDPDNTAFLIEKRYSGQCSGSDAPEGAARFFSKTRKPAPGLRVIVRNITFGFSGDQKPHTDREYFHGDISEGFLVKFGDYHNGQYLAVQPGTNQFDYVIKSGQIVLESGKFSMNIAKKIITEQRDAYPTSESYCDHYYQGRCVYHYRTVYRCR